MFVTALDNSLSDVQHLRTELSRGVGARWRQLQYPTSTERPSSLVANSLPRYNHHHQQQQQQHLAYRHKGAIIGYFLK